MDSADRQKEFILTVGKYRDMVWRICFRMLADREDARDAAQETFVRAWQTLHRYDSRYSMATWLGTIACRLCIDVLRKRRLRLKIETETAGSNGNTSPDPGAYTERNEIENLLQRAVRALSPMQKAVFILHEIEQLPAWEIQRISGLSAVQIKSNLYIARQKVRKALIKEGIQY